MVTKEFVNVFLTNGYLEKTTIDNCEILHFKRPCRFNLNEEIVADLKRHYKSDEEIGGILWAKPYYNNGDLVYQVEKVSYIRNAIEDNLRDDRRTKKNSYLRDINEYNSEYRKCIDGLSLPIRFHTQIGRAHV